ncbi:ran-binding protein 3 [Sarcoptes scabiei]|nr:ran-binding protein 3 [Sarcoptes scabiei]
MENVFTFIFPSFWNELVVGRTEKESRKERERDQIEYFQIGYSARTFGAVRVCLCWCVLLSLRIFEEIHLSFLKVLISSLFCAFSYFNHCSNQIRLERSFKVY